MTRRRSLLRVIGAMGAGAAAAADWKQKDPVRLRATAVAVAVSGDPAGLADLARQMSNRKFLRRLDPDAQSVAGLAEVFHALATHPKPATAALCLQVARSEGFGEIPARWNLLLPALAAVRPMDAESAKVFVETGRSGFLEVNVPLLAANACPLALGVMETLMADETLPAAQRISAAHWGLLPNRLTPGVVEACSRIVERKGLSSAVETAILESLFDYRPAEWFGKRSPHPTAPAWDRATPAAGAAYRSLAAAIRRRPSLPVRLRQAIDDSLSRLGGG